MKKVAVIMGSASDLPVVEKAVKVLKEYGVPCEVHVYSAHRTPEQAGAFAAGARQAGFGVIIAAAGKAAHLAGVMAAHSTLPVIGLPSGVPVATVAINGAANAALLAIQMLAIEEETLQVKLQQAKQVAAEQALAKDAEITELYSAEI